MASQIAAWPGRGVVLGTLRCVGLVRGGKVCQGAVQAARKMAQDLAPSLVHGRSMQLGLARPKPGIPVKPGIDLNSVRQAGPGQAVTLVCGHCSDKGRQRVDAHAGKGSSGVRGASGRAFQQRRMRLMRMKGRAAGDCVATYYGGLKSMAASLGRKAWGHQGLYSHTWCHGPCQTRLSTPARSSSASCTCTWAAVTGARTYLTSIRLCTYIRYR